MEKQFKKSDNDVASAETKIIYKLIQDLNVKYINYYMQLPYAIKNANGINIYNKTAKLLDMIVCIYFQKEKYDNYDYINDMYLLLKQIEFQIRIIYQNKIITKHQYEIISKIMADLGENLKERLKTYD